MTTDLHTRLLAAVQQRMDVARAATPGPWHQHWADAGIRGSEQYAWVIADGPNGGAVVERHNGGTRADIEFIAANDPATVLRHCERDLAVLKRHHAEQYRTYVACDGCEGSAWPCAEITDLAAAYGVDADGG